jgi:hypothetical protein
MAEWYISWNFHPLLYFYQSIFRWLDATQKSKIVISKISFTSFTNGSKFGNWQNIFLSNQEKVVLLAEEKFGSTSASRCLYNSCCLYPVVSNHSLQFYFICILRHATFFSSLVNQTPKKKIVASNNRDFKLLFQL